MNLICYDIANAQSKTLQDFTGFRKILQDFVRNN